MDCLPIRSPSARIYYIRGTLESYERFCGARRIQTSIQNKKKVSYCVILSHKRTL